MGIVRKQDYWSKDNVIVTPFVSTVMARDHFQNIMTFFHLADNTTYPKKDSDDYDPRLKLGKLFNWLSTSFTEIWSPRKNLSIDEGCIPFKGKVGFKCYNPKNLISTISRATKLSIPQIIIAFNSICMLGH